MAAAAAAVDDSATAGYDREHFEVVLSDVKAKIEAASDRARAAGTFTKAPRLVAVSKTKPLADILAAHAAGHRNFGENYVQELAEKAADPAVPSDLSWRFIGTLQSNKVKLVTAVAGLAAIETVTSIKLANAIEKAMAGKERESPLEVYVQVNVSGEDQKGGVPPLEVPALVRHIHASCPSLRFVGLMTIGEYGRVVLPGDSNPDFTALAECRTTVCAELEIPEAEMELSMGMSGDYEHAIEVGSTNVRVGSSIFGARQYKTKE